MAYALFLLLNAILFIRPAELIESLQPFRLYQLVILLCMAASYQAVLPQLQGRSLAKHPITLCVIGLLAIIVASHLRHGSIYCARTSGFMFFKIVLYYLLLVANVDTGRKLQRFLTCLVLFTTVAAALALLQYHDYVNIPALAAYQQYEIDQETGEMIVFPRLCGTGIFNDPNDVCLILTMVMMLCLYRFNTPGAGPKRFLWLLPMLLFFATFLCTKSRGGFLAMMTAVSALTVSRIGFRKSIPLALVAIPAVLVLFGGRMTQIEVDGGTGQHRIQLWREALSLLREYPIFGVGQGMLSEYTRLVAHNSYIHSYAELGLIGGTFFVSMVFLAVAQLHGLKKRQASIQDPEMRRLRPYLLAIVCGYAAGIMFLSRVYIVPTYMLFALAAAFLVQTETSEEPTPSWRFSPGLVARLSAISVGALIFLEVSSRVLVQWEG